MWVIGSLGFTAPLVLWALALLPVLWWLLRAVPPAPLRRRFPGVALLLGLRDAKVETARTPWWLLALRMLALGGLIVAFAGPVLNPVQRAEGSGPLLVLLDGGWADARDWSRRLEFAQASVEDAGRQGRAVAVVRLTDPPAGDLPFQPASAWRERLDLLTPTAWEPAEPAALWAEGLSGEFDTLWLSDGLARPSRARVMAALEARGALRVFETARPVMGLAPATYAEGEVTLDLRRSRAGSDASADVLAIGPDPSGILRELARSTAVFAAADTSAKVSFDLPPEIRNRIQRFEVEGMRGAGTVALADDSLRRRKVALIAGRDAREGLQLLSPVHYLRQALAPVADLLDGGLLDVLLASPDVVVLADVARLSFQEEEALQAWLDKGGLLLRFAGPRMAAANTGTEDSPFLPVHLREGGRSVGGAMTWGEPRRLADFAQGSPFFGLSVPADVTVTAQVLAQPDPDLSERTIATLADGTPLVTRRAVGEGQVVLFHVTANAEWSTLPLSGLFVQMLERLAISARVTQPEVGDLEGTIWQAEQVLDGFGRLTDGSKIAAIEGPALVTAMSGQGASAEVPPGLYAQAEQRLALNVMGRARVLEPAIWPERIPLEGQSETHERGLKGAFLLGALLALLFDALATLGLSGRLRRAAPLAVLMAAVLFSPLQSKADDAKALEATSQVVLAHVKTGNTDVDRTAEAGLAGLGIVLATRTTIEPAKPMMVDLETDELAFYPFLYWPITADQPMPSPAAYRKLNAYLRTGGMILFDTRDGDVADFGGATPEGRRLQMLAQPLDIPPLEPIPEDHVLTRTFYLLQDFPGRHTGRSIWVEAAPVDAELAEGMPFRNLNDGVTPVVIGGNDWASAWAVDANGVPLLPVGRGFAGQRQREIAARFGVNLIMHVLTGNYKSDQVHVPALLERLGQ